MCGCELGVMCAKHKALLPKVCAVPDCTSTKLVYSGTDAFMLGVPTEVYCYTCANIFSFITSYETRYEIAK